MGAQNEKPRMQACGVLNLVVESITLSNLPNNACGLVRKRTESCGLITLRQHLMKPGAKTPLALLQ